MQIKTKKFSLDKKTYIRLGMQSLLREWWWAWLVLIPILALPIFVKGALWWCLFAAVLLSGLYLAFVWVQFAGVSQMEQAKQMFDKYVYEIDSRQILAKINEREGMKIEWGKIQKVKQTKDYFLFYLSRGQFLYFPNQVFLGKNDVKFLEAILRRKNLLPATEPAAEPKPETTSSKR
jgi:hypothetical protein